MKSLTIALFLLTCVLSQATAVGFPQFYKGQTGTALNLTGYKLAWEDEFNTLGVMRDGKGTGPWFSGVHSLLAAGEKMALVPDPAYSVAGGILNLSTRLDPSDHKRVEAHLQTADHHNHVVAFQNGYFEARLFLPRARGSHSGFWIESEERGAGHTEIDIVEAYGAGDYVLHSASHIWPIAPRRPEAIGNYQRLADIYTGFHLYGVMATDDLFIFYYDRKELARIPRTNEQRVPLFMLLSEFGNPTATVIDQPATMLVDYVRVYTPAK